MDTTQAVTIIKIVGDLKDVQQVRPFIQKLKTDLANSEAQVKVTAKTMKDMGTAAGGAGIDIGKLAQRAAITIPIWVAMRTAFMGVLQYLKDGADYMVEFDAAMARSKAVVSGVKDIDEFMKRLGTTIKQLSTESGKSVKEVSDIFYRFAETGMNAEEAMQGMTVALKLSVGTFASTEETARIMVDLMNNLGDSFDKNMSTMDKFNTIAGTFAVLWKENAGNLNEYIQALAKFVPTARNVGLGLQETMAVSIVLNNAMQRGTSAGTSLARVFERMTKNSEDVAVALGMTSDEFDKLPKWEAFIKLLEKNQQALETGLPENLSSTTKEFLTIFGERGARGAESATIQLTKLLDLLKRLKEFTPGDFAQKVADLYKGQTDTLKIQIDRFDQLKKQASEAFITAITGSDSLLGALQKVNDFMQNTLIPTMIATGVYARRALNPQETVAKFLAPKYWETKFGADFQALNRSRGGSIGAADFEKRDFENAVREYKAAQTPEDRFRILTERLGASEDKAMATLSTTDEMYLRYLKQQQGYILPEQAPKPEAIVSRKTTTDTTEVNKQQEQKDFWKLARESKEWELQQANKLKLFGADQLDIEKKKLEIMIERKKDLEDEKEIIQQIIKIQDEANNKMIEFSTTLQKSMEDSFSSFLQGNSSAKDALASIAGTASDATFSQLGKFFTKQIFKSTGIGSIFGQLMTSLEDHGTFGNQIIEASVEGSQMYKDAIEGATPGLFANSLGGTVASFAGASSTGVSNTLGGFGTVGSMLVNNTSFGNIPIGGINEGMYSDVATGQLMNANGTPATTMGSTIGGVATSALIGYGQYNNVVSRTGNNGMGLLSGGLMGIGAMTALINPYAGIGIMLLGALTGLFADNKKETTQTTVQEQTTEHSVTSRIDITNKQLELVNRNLIALKSSFETYVLPESAYYGEKRNMEDQFSLHARRGLNS